MANINGVKDSKILGHSIRCSACGHTYEGFKARLKKFTICRDCFENPKIMEKFKSYAFPYRPELFQDWYQRQRHLANW